MKPGISGLLDEFRLHRDSGRMLVLATIVAAQGSTYRKPGARMLLGENGRCFGLLGGGCFEADLIERSYEVRADGRARVAPYDMRTPDDALWGLGLGCNGAVNVLLQRLDPANAYQPLAALDRAIQARHARVVATVVDCSRADALGSGVIVGDGLIESDTLPAGLRSIILDDARASLNERRSQLLRRHANSIAATVFYDCVLPPPHVLVLGAGVDAVPLVRLCKELGWQITVADHRPAEAHQFQEVDVVVTATPGSIDELTAASDYAAAIVMSHNLAQDRLYTAALARSAIPYIGLLGPAARRQALLDGLGGAARRLEGRSFGPVGLDIGAESPEEIALSIVAGLQAFLSGCPGGVLPQDRTQAASWHQRKDRHSAAGPVSSGQR